MGGEGPLISYLLITLTAININAVENLEEVSYRMDTDECHPEMIQCRQL